MRSLFTMCILFGFMLKGAVMEAQGKNVMIFYKTAGFWHESIPAGYQLLEDLGEANNFATNVTDEAEDFNEEELGEYDLVIFLNTTGDVLNTKQQNAFEEYINGGGSYFGIHAAADTETGWRWYGDLVGAYFDGHPPVQVAEIVVVKPTHYTVAHLPHRWRRKDEWYNYRNINPEIEVLLRLDESTYSGGKNGKDHPFAWYRDLEGGGKAIYTGGGHTIESYVEPAFVEHLLRCIKFALGEEK